eukprot:TRINITY_DN55814_c0_g1_i1.p1 TRINITY_DN55814_c0_g1~~TRINITY_DN55814_c0_g1_i1.p1  ORF type:complete len:370 (+),score=95.51 TRINITY_DN55814_c0_g1_i1:88-1197(+)
MAQQGAGSEQMAEQGAGGPLLSPRHSEQAAPRESEQAATRPSGPTGRRKRPARRRQQAWAKHADRSYWQQWKELKVESTVFPDAAGVYNAAGPGKWECAGWKLTWSNADWWPLRSIALHPEGGGVLASAPWFQPKEPGEARVVALNRTARVISIEGSAGRAHLALRSMTSDLSALPVAVLRNALRVRERQGRLPAKLAGCGGSEFVLEVRPRGAPAEGPQQRLSDRDCLQDKVCCIVSPEAGGLPPSDGGARAAPDVQYEDEEEGTDSYESSAEGGEKAPPSTAPAANVSQDVTSLATASVADSASIAARARRPGVPARTARLQGLKGAKHLNGRVVQVVSESSGAGKYRVLLDGEPFAVAAACLDFGS